MSVCVWEAFVFVWPVFLRVVGSTQMAVWDAVSYSAEEMCGKTHTLFKMDGPWQTDSAVQWGKVPVNCLSSAVLAL